MTSGTDETTDRRLVMPVLAEGTTPVVGRLEPLGLVRFVPPGHVAYVLAKGPKDGQPEIERSDEELVVRGWSGAVLAITESKPAPVDADVDACLRGVALAIAEGTPAFAALVGARHARVLDDLRAWQGGATPRAIVNRLFAASKGLPLARAATEAWIEDLQQAAKLVDPDRGDASEAWRALRVLDTALHAGTTGFEPRSADLALAALAASAEVSGAPDALAAEVGARWARPAVQGEARWLRVIAEAIRLLPLVDAAAVDALARACGLLAGASSSGASSSCVRLEVAGRSITLFEVDTGRYIAELDGARRPIRTRTVKADYWDEGPGDIEPEPPWDEGAAADTTLLSQCLAKGATRTATERTTTFDLKEQWGHYRQNRYVRVFVAIAEDGAVELDGRVVMQDDSYY